MKKKIIIILNILWLSPILIAKSYFINSKFVLGRGDFICEGITNDNKYIVEVFSYSVKIYFLSNNKKLFLTFIKTDQKIKKVFYKDHNLFLKFANETIRYNIKSDNIKKEDDKKKKSLRLTRKKKNQLKHYYIAITQNGIKINKKVITLENKPLAYIYHTNKNIKLKGKKKKIKGKERKFLTYLFKDLKPAKEIIEDKYINTASGVLVFFPNSTKFFKLLEKYKNKTSDEKTLEVLIKVYNEKSIIKTLLKVKIKKNKEKEVEKLIKKYYSLFKKDKELNTLIGEFYYNRNNYKNAEKYLKKVNTPYAKLLLANIYVVEKKISKAEKIYRRIILKNKTFYKAYNNLASIYIKKKKYRKAEKLLLQGIQNNPTNYTLYYNLGLLYEKTGKLPIAVSLYEKANSLAQKTEKDYPKKEIIERLYYSYLKMAMINDAEELIKEILKKEPNDPISHYNLGYIYELKKEKEKAIFHYTIFLEINKNKRLGKLVKKRIQKLLSTIKSSS